jgi:hypothetical protein
MDLMTSDASTNTVKLNPNRLPAMEGLLKTVGGSQSDDWNETLVDQTIAALWHGGKDIDARKKQVTGAVAALVGTGPRDEMEGMIATQMIATHNASMECLRRAMIPDQHPDARQANLNQANKLSRTYAALMDALNKHRGKGQQRVTVEHVHVNEGGQAIVGAVAKGGRG